MSNLRKYIIVGLLVIIIVSLSSCKKNDNPVSSESSIAGTWVLANITAQTSSGIVTLTADQAQVHITMVTKSDNTYQMTIIQKDSTASDTGTYAISGGNITFTSKTGTSLTWTYSISGSTLTAKTTMDLSAYGFPGQTPVTLVFNKQ